MRPDEAKVQAHTVPILRGLARAMQSLRVDDTATVTIGPAGPSRASAATRRRRRAVRNARRANRRR